MSEENIEPRGTSAHTPDLNWSQVRETVLGNVGRRRHPVGSLDLGKDVVDEIPQHGQLQVPLIELTDVGVCVIIGSSHDVCSIQT